jgi:hypothetical protein
MESLLREKTMLLIIVLSSISLLLYILCIVIVNKAILKSKSLLEKDAAAILILFAPLVLLFWIWIELLQLVYLILLKVWKYTKVKAFVEYISDKLGERL